MSTEVLNRSPGAPLGAQPPHGGYACTLCSGDIHRGLFRQRESVMAAGPVDRLQGQAILPSRPPNLQHDAGFPRESPPNVRRDDKFSFRRQDRRTLGHSSTPMLTQLGKAWVQALTRRWFRVQVHSQSSRDDGAAACSLEDVEAFGHVPARLAGSLRRRPVQVPCSRIPKAYATERGRWAHTEKTSRPSREVKSGVGRGTRTPTGCPIRPSNVCVCLFRHPDRGSWCRRWDLNPHELSLTAP